MDSFESRVSRRRLLSGAGVAGLGVLGAALVGCSEDEETATATATAAASGGSGGAAATSAAATSSSTPVAGTQLPAEFVFANDAEPGDLGPWFANFSTGLVTKNIYEPLVEPFLMLNPDGTPHWEVRGVLAESFEAVTPAIYRLKLREGVKFHNGEDWNADAAVASFNFLVSDDVMEPLQKTNFAKALFKRFEKVDEATVEIEFVSPGIEGLTLYQQFGFVGLPPSITSGTDGSPLLENPVGTGPLRFRLVVPRL